MHIHKTITTYSICITYVPPLHLDFHLILGCHSLSISNFNLIDLFSTERGKRDLEH